RSSGRTPSSRRPRGARMVTRSTPSRRPCPTPRAATRSRCPVGLRPFDHGSQLTRARPMGQTMWHPVEEPPHMNRLKYRPLTLILAGVLCLGTSALPRLARAAQEKETEKKVKELDTE